MKCAICGKQIKSNRYILKIVSYAAYNGLEINLLDFTRDYEKELQQLVEKLKRQKKSMAEEDVFKTFKFDLCRSCHQRYIKNPLGKNPKSEKFK